MVTLLPACEGAEEEPTLEGTYEIRSHTNNTAGCDAEGEAAQSDATHFELREESFFGVPLLEWHDCTAADSCDDSVLLDKSFTREGEEWLSETSWASGGSTDCSLGLTEGTITETDEGVRVEFRSYSGTVMLEGSEACDTDLAQTRRDELACESYEVIEGSLI